MPLAEGTDSPPPRRVALLSDIPSASGDVASQFPHSESTEVDGEAECEADSEAAPRRLRIRGEATVPDEEPTTELGKALILPNDVE